MKFRISEKYRLELHWNDVVYKTDGEAELSGAVFTGPVLREVDQMSSNDYMDLDFARQYIIFVKRFYIARLSWCEVIQKSGVIYLQNAVLKNKHVNSVPKINNDDYIVIDTSGHEDEKHQYNLVYPSYLIKHDGESYNFKR